MAQSSTRHQWSLVVPMVAAALICCGTNNGGTGKLHTFGADGNVATVGGSSAGNTGVAGAGASGAGGTSGAIGLGGGGSGASDGGAAATAGAGGVGGGGGAGGANAGAGGTSSSGSSNGGSSNGGSSNGGSGGLGDQLLSQGKPASADSEQAGNLAASGNDGSTTTRWCANDGGLGHYWKVDLGATFTLTKLQISWENAAVYQFKVDGSADGSNWSPVLDQTGSTSNQAVQAYVLSAPLTARWVRITVTGLAPGVWASFFEFGVVGY